MAIRPHLAVIRRVVSAGRGVRSPSGRRAVAGHNGAAGFGGSHPLARTPPAYQALGVADRKLRSNFTPGTTPWAMRRAQWSALGLTDEDLEKPKIAIVNSSSQLASCFSHLDEIVGPRPPQGR